MAEPAPVFTPLPRDYVTASARELPRRPGLPSVWELSALRFHEGEEEGAFHCRVSAQTGGPAELALADFRRFAAGHAVAVYGDEGCADDFLRLLASSGCLRGNTVIDVARSARLALPGLDSYGLRALKSRLGMEGVCDLRAVSLILVRCRKRLCLRSCPPTGPAAPPAAAQEASRAPATRHVDLFHPLFGKHLAFTGHFRRSRGELCSLASACGAVVRSGVSRRTDYLVVGSPPPRSGTARALQRASELNSAGRAKIRLLTESEFLSLVQGDKNRPASS